MKKKYFLLDKLYYMAKVSTIIYDTISKNMSTAYLFSGGSIMSLINHFHPKNNINKMKYFVPSSEMSAGFCSIGHNKSKNKCDSVIITTSGPGLTNVLTALTDAYCDGIPLLVISGDVATDMQGKHAFQEAPVMDLTKSITTWNYSINQADETVDVLTHAINLVNNGKQVHINVPKNILNTTSIINNTDIGSGSEIFNFRYKTRNKKLCCRTEFELNESNSNFNNKIIKKCATIINNASRPVLYIGRGCIDASYELSRLALKANIPVTTTIHGLGIFNESHYLSLKMLGMHGSERANNAIQLADCIICIGARFDDRTVGDIKTYGRNAKHIIHVNSNITEFNKVINNTINIFGYSKHVLTDLLFYIKSRPNVEWIDQLQKYSIDFPYSKNCLKQQDVLLILNKELEKNFKLKDKLLITTGVGNHQMFAAQLLTHSYPNRFITSGSLGTMGSSNSMAIGAKIANPEYIVLSIDGDQSFNMLNDLKMIMTYNIPIKMIIMNDSKQSMVNIWEKLFFNNNIVATETTNPNYNTLACAYNIKNLYINNDMDTDTITSIISIFINYDFTKPILLNCYIESDYCLPLVPPGNALDNMITFNNIHEFNVNNSSSAPS
jgi:acetolactate synthase-1/2/3 large subunit